MHLLLYFLSLLLYGLAGRVCENGYIYFESEDLCLIASIAQTPLSFADGTCRDQYNGGILYKRRMSDELFKEFEENLGKAATPIDAFVGMKKDSSLNSKKWIYSNDAGSVEQDKFPYWTKDPRSEDCGVMESKEKYKITPYSCSHSSLAICEKKARPCFHDNMQYIEYFGKCLSPSGQKAGYPTVENFCMDGHVLPVTDDESYDAAVSVLYSFSAPIFAGLRNVDGKWVYDEDGEEELERFEPGYEREQDCGAYGLKKDGTVALFTGSCKGAFRVICEQKEVDLAQIKIAGQSLSSVIPCGIRQRISEARKDIDLLPCISRIHHHFVNNLPVKITTE